MSVFRPLLQYFKEGAVLANNSFDIYLIGLSSWAFTYLGSRQFSSPVAEIISIITLIAIFIYFAFDLSIPRFLQDVRKDKEFSYVRLFRITMRNTRRIILPGILIMAFLLILGFVGFFLYSLIFIARGFTDLNQLMQTGDELGKLLVGWNPVGILFTVSFAMVSTLLIFTSIYFSIEKVGLVRSIYKSFLISLRHRNFILLVAVINIAVYLFLKLLPTGQNIGGFISFAIANYVNLVLLATSLLYYKREIKKTP